MLLVEKCNEGRMKQGLTIKQVSELAKIPFSTTNAYLKGEVKNPSLMTTGSICAVCGVSLDAHFGIVSPDMDETEIERINAEHAAVKDELESKIQEHAQNILAHEVTISNKEEIIRRQDIRISELNDRIKSQVFVINIFRIWILALHIYAFVMDSMVPDAGLIRGLNWGGIKPDGLVTVSIIVVLSVSSAVWAFLRHKRRKEVDGKM